ncbi:hypothetical protein PTI98_007330 [Pleurotus ostreatus]|nr:hypothetical protein PTI98_007330 [Pleurotus ostreatus]
MSVLQFCLGRPSVRWIPWCAAILFSFWFIGPFVLDLRHHAEIGFYPPRPGRMYPPPPPPMPRPPNAGAPPSIWAERAHQVRLAFVHAYDGYRKYAHGYDELRPLTAGSVNNFNGWGVTLFDAIDTMWIMGVWEPYQDAVEFVAGANFSMTDDEFAPFFETVIRYLGGLLSAYALSGEEVFLSRADDLGRMLLPAFDTPSGFPMYAVNTITGKTRPGWTGKALWAECLSNQVEFKYLAHLTGRPDFYRKSESAMSNMYAANVSGVFPTMWDIGSGSPANTQHSVGAYADSAHEYLLKQWLVTGRTEPKVRSLYIESANAIINNLLYVTPKRRLLYVTDTSGGIASHKFEHLSCFLPGLLALGAHTLSEDALSPRDRERHLLAAQGIAHTCWTTYNDMGTGLGPDEMTMAKWSPDADGKWVKHLEEWEKQGRLGEPPGVREVQREAEWGERDYTAMRPTYLLRPEAIESFYILWKTTGDEVWRERGYRIFQSIQRYARTEFGYASVGFVDSPIPTLRDEMPSYFLAETLKYLYLLFTDADVLPLDKWVLNTEAHPLPVFDWHNWERKLYNITTD